MACPIALLVCRKDLKAPLLGLIWLIVKYLSTNSQVLEPPSLVELEFRLRSFWNSSDSSSLQIKDVIWKERYC